MYNLLRGSECSEKNIAGRGRRGCGFVYICECVYREVIVSLRRGHCGLDLAYRSGPGGRCRKCESSGRSGRVWRVCVSAARVVGVERGRETEEGDGPGKSLSWTWQNLLSHCRPLSLLLSEVTSWKGLNMQRTNGICEQAGRVQAVCSAGAQKKDRAKVPPCLLRALGLVLRWWQP